MNEDRELEAGFASVAGHTPADPIREMAQVLIRSGSAGAVRARLASPVIPVKRQPVGAEDAAMQLAFDDLMRRRT